MFIDPGHNGTLGWKIENGQDFGVYDLSWKHGARYSPPDLNVTLIIERNGMIEPPTIYVRTKSIEAVDEQLVSGGDAEKLTVRVARYVGTPYYLGLARGYGETESSIVNDPKSGLGDKQVRAIYKITAVAPTKAPQVLTSLDEVGAIDLTLHEPGELYYANRTTMQWEPVASQNQTRLGFYAMVVATSSTAE